MKIAPKIKLSYFDIEGRAESIRLALTLAGIPFEDHRVQRNEWEVFKKATPYGQLPVMSIDDGPLRAQSQALLRWIGTELCPALYPKDRLFDIEEAMGVALDAHEARVPALFLNFHPECYGHPSKWNQTEEGKRTIKAMREKIVSEQLPKFTAYFKDLLAKNDNKWLASTEGPTLADCVAIPVLRSFTTGFMDHVPPNCLDDYPEIVSYVKRFCSLPQIAGRYEKGLH